MIRTFVIVKNADCADSTSIDLRVRGVKTNREGLITFINGVLSAVERDAVSVRGGAKAEQSRSWEIMI